MKTTLARQDRGAANRDRHRQDRAWIRRPGGLRPILYGNINKPLDSRPQGDVGVAGSRIGARIERSIAVHHPCLSWSIRLGENTRRGSYDRDGHRVTFDPVEFSLNGCASGTRNAEWHQSIDLPVLGIDQERCRSADIDTASREKQERPLYSSARSISKPGRRGLGDSK